MAGTSEEWVQILEDGKLAYCWNRRTQETTYKTVPSNWSAQKDPSSGNYYFWRKSSNQTVWQLPELEQNTATPEGTKSFPPDSESPPFSEVGVADEWEASDSWVRVEAGPAYYWNFKIGISLDYLPLNQTPRWEAIRSSNDSWYYVDIETQETMWELPSTCRCPKNPQDPPTLEPPWLEIGAAVRIVNLEEQKRFNGQVGVLIDAMPGRCLIRLPEEISGQILSVRPEKIDCLHPGAIVEIHGLSRQDLNGTMATVRTFQPQNRRYQVGLPNISQSEDILVRSTNLRPKSPLWNIHAHLAPGKTPTSLQWRGELGSLFIDKQGQHRNFMLHLPPGFNLRPNPHSVDADVHKYAIHRWPLIVYLHGAGGGTFFTHSKKSLKTEMMQKAAKCFVVVSPRCEWTWRDTPSTWVVELTRAFSALEWIDNERIYLTGVSMGGMGAWEVGSQAPDLFAAVCPVAAHHKSERSPWIAAQLRHTPVYVVHDDTDDTCPMSQEQPLWKLLEDGGHGDFKKVISHDVDHCKIFEQAYASSQEFYEWLHEKKLGSMCRSPSSRGNRTKSEFSSGGG